MSFTTFTLAQSILDGLARQKITNPTAIQAAVIPVALAGKDILASAHTGSGKTIGFLAPLITHLMNNKNSTGLVLTPTREIAAQVHDVALQLIDSRFIKTALLIGGDPMPRQFGQLRRSPRLIIGTPGRVIDHLERETLSLQATDFLVLDETDRMLDLGFNEQIERICTYVPTQRQTLLFSATIPPKIARLASQYLSNPERIAVDPATQDVPKIKQDIIHTTPDEKFSVLIKELDERKGSVIIFVKTKRGADKLSKKLNDLSHSSKAIHGDLRQSKRTHIIESFRARKNRIMVATDVAARGLDVPHIQHVVNYDLPQCPEDYVHRIGRTGRAGATGSALSLIVPEDNFLWARINHFIDPVKNPKPGFARTQRRRPARRRFAGTTKPGFAGSAKPNTGFGRPRKPSNRFQSEK